MHVRGSSEENPRLRTLYPLLFAPFPLEIRAQWSELVLHDLAQATALDQIILLDFLLFLEDIARLRRIDPISGLSGDFAI